jgi:pilus assembly protein CpaF
MVAVKNIARRLGDDISEQKPILDSRLPDGSRVAAVIPPCSIHGVTLTIRKFNGRHFTIEDLVKCGSLDAILVERLKNYVERRQNILISGGTGTGKTTLLNALGKLISDDDRILLIEDTSEIQLQKPNLVRFEARQAQAGLPAVAIRELLKASLRHRPDRIILGEIRGGEAFDLLQFLNTGHSGKQHAPEDLLRFWLGHANKSVTDGYSKLKEDVPFRKKVVEQVGIGFELPADKREVAPNCTQSELLSTFA